MSNLHVNSPFYDLYDPEKQYTKVLTRPGKVAQSREIIELQSMLRDFIGRLGDATIGNGGIVDGCNIIIRDNEAVISEGRLYIDGLVRLVNSTKVTITGVGSEVIGAIVTQTIISDDVDNSLRDPAQEMQSYGQSGAFRDKEIVEFVLNSDEAIPIYRIEDGSLVKDYTNDNDGTNLTATLARRTHDENGNFKINGLELRDRGESNDSKILITLTEGKAYVLGYEVIKQVATLVKLNYSQTTRQILAEPKIYRAGTDEYLLNNQPAKEFSQVKAEVSITEQITRGNIIGGIDFLSYTPVTRIISVTQGSKTFIEGTDFQLVNDGIDWSLHGSDPNTGSTYTVVYYYNKIFKIDNEIELYTNPNNGLDYLKFIGAEKPVNNTSIDISYSFYLARKDLVCLDKNGNVIVLEGKPDIVRLTEPPINQNEGLLNIGTVLINPNSTSVVIVNLNTTRFTQIQVYNLHKRVDDIEINQAISDLDLEAENNESATTLRGILTDGFVGTTKADMNHPLYNCTIDLDLKELTLPTNISIMEMKPDESNVNTKIANWGRVITAPYEHNKYFSQNKATRSFLVNPYAVYNPMSLVSLNPAIDNWIDSSRIVVESQVTKTNSLQRWWYHRGEPWAEAERQKWIQLGYADGGASLEWENGVKTSTTTTTDIVLDELVTYMRQREVTVTGTNFTKNVDNVRCIFNDTVVPITPIAPCTAGTMTGTLKATSGGEIKGKFMIPPNTPSGTVSVVMDSGVDSGTAVYQSQGRKIVLQDNVLTTTVVTETWDPLAQTFMFEEDIILSQLGLYFATKDPDYSVVVQVRNTVNGYPGTIIYDQTVVKAEDIVTSSNSSGVTNVTFNQPIYCTAGTMYCFVILSDSNLYSMYTATLGEKDLITDNYVTSNPYITGTMFSSSNALTWTVHQDMDVKFDIYNAKYNENAQIIFEDVDNIQINRLVLASQILDYKNNGSEWSYRIGGTDSSWLPIESYVDRELSQIANKISLKLVMKSTWSTSPIIAGDSINLIGFIEETEGVYVSRQVVMETQFTNVKVSVEFCLPTSTAAEVYYMLDDGSWIKMENPTITRVDDEFSRYDYMDSGVLSRSYRVMIKLMTSNPLIRPRARKLINIMKV